LTNTGSTTITVTNIATSGQFSQSNNCTSPLAPTMNCTINVVFQPTGSGTQKGTLTITDNAGTQTASLSGAATVMDLSPSSLNFGAQTVKTSSPPQVITVTNVGASIVNIQKISINGPRTTSYSDTTTCTSTLGAGASCTISVTFTPQLKGVLNAAINVTDMGGGSPQIVPLTGTGQ
jgi:hypothetical protein